MESQVSQTRMQELVLTLEGELMEGGSIEYRTLLKTLSGTVGALDEISRIANYPHQISYRVKPPKEKCFEITFQAVELLASITPLFPQFSTAKDILSCFVEYMKLRAALGDSPNPARIEASGNTGVTIIGDHNTVIFQITPDIARTALESRPLNKKIDEAISSVAKDAVIDVIKYSLPGENIQQVVIPKSEFESYKFFDEIREEEDQIIGYVREIDNTDYKGYLNILDAGKMQSVKFELEIKDIAKLDQIVTDLCIAEARKARVALLGQKVLFKGGKIKLIKVYDIKLIDGKFEF